MASSPLLENRGPALEIGKNFAIDVVALPTCIMKYATAISPLQMKALMRVNRPKAMRNPPISWIQPPVCVNALFEPGMPPNMPRTNCPP